MKDISRLIHDNLDNEVTFWEKLIVEFTIDTPQNFQFNENSEFRKLIKNFIQTFQKKKGLFTESVKVVPNSSNSVSNNEVKIYKMILHTYHYGYYCCY
jgi:hypothetical protein